MEKKLDTLSIDLKCFKEERWGMILRICKRVLEFQRKTTNKIHLMNDQIKNNRLYFDIVEKHEELVINDKLELRKKAIKKQKKIHLNKICDYCIEGGFCGKKPSLKCFDGIEIIKE